LSTDIEKFKVFGFDENDGGIGSGSTDTDTKNIFIGWFVGIIDDSVNVRVNAN